MATCVQDSDPNISLYPIITRQLEQHSWIPLVRDLIPHAWSLALSVLHSLMFYLLDNKYAVYISIGTSSLRNHI